MSPRQEPLMVSPVQLELEAGAGSQRFPYRLSLGSTPMSVCLSRHAMSQELLRGDIPPTSPSLSC